MDVMETLKALAARVRTWVADVLLPEMKARPAVTVCVVAAGAIGGLLWLGSSIVINGLVAGGLMAIGTGVILWKTKHSQISIVSKAYQVVISYPLASDIGITALAFCLAPSGLTAWIAASVTGLIVSCWLLVENTMQTIPVEPRQFKIVEAEVVGVTG